MESSRHRWRPSGCGSHHPASRTSSRPSVLARFRQEVAAARQVSGAYTAPVVDASGAGEDPPWPTSAPAPSHQAASPPQADAPSSLPRVPSAGYPVHSSTTPAGLAAEWHPLQYALQGVARMRTCLWRGQCANTEVNAMPRKASASRPLDDWHAQADTTLTTASGSMPTSKTIGGADQRRRSITDSAAESSRVGPD